MQSLALADLPVVGAVETQTTDTGVVYRRNPSWALPQIVEPLHDIVVRMPAGVRLALQTASSSIELDVDLTTFAIVGTEELLPSFDLVVPGREVEHHLVTGSTRVEISLDRSINVIPGQPATVTVALPGDPAVPVEIWFPHNAVMELRAVRIAAGATWKAAPAKEFRWIHYGSSISHCLEAPTPTQSWPAIVALAAGVDLLHLGLGGQAQVDQHVARLIRDQPADLISLKLGINVVNADCMRERTFLPAVHGFLDTVRDGHPATPVVLASPIICPVAEDHPGPTILREDRKVHVVARDPELLTGSLTLRRVRELLADVVAARSDANLHLLDGLSLFGEADVDLLPDGLHPNAEGYRRIAERFHAQVRTLGLLPP